MGEPIPYIAQTTIRMVGIVFFSFTLGLNSLPGPFKRSNKLGILVISKKFVNF
jgi:hypothetical protein